MKNWNSKKSKTKMPDLRMTSYDCGHSNFFFSLIFLKIRQHYRAANSVWSCKCSLTSRKPKIKKLMKIENEKNVRCRRFCLGAHLHTSTFAQLSPLWLWSLWIIPYGIQITIYFITFAFRTCSSTWVTLNSSRLHLFSKIF